jgi:hypothetical protein
MRRFFRRPWVAAILVLGLALSMVTLASAAAGWSSGRGAAQATQQMEEGLYLLEQYNQGVAELEAGNYLLAFQRIDYVFQQDPEFLDIADLWTEVNLVISRTAQPTDIIRPTATATPTQDPRPKEELLVAAQELFNNQQWNQAIDTLLALRKADPNYETVQVDGMLYAALRNRGVHHILQEGLFAAGLYDFALAEKFGPLDGQALTYREWARLYLYGNAFWYAYPQEAAYYYGQLVGAAPDLRDASGLSAFYRYSQSLVHYAEQVAKSGDTCAAWEAYLTALSVRVDASIQPTADYLAVECVGQTPSVTFTPTASGTLTPTLTGTLVTGTPTWTAGASTATFTAGPATATNTPANTPTPTNTPVPSDTPMPTAIP